MFEALLNFIVEHKVYIHMEGLYIKDEPILKKQGDVFTTLTTHNETIAFTKAMVNKITFHTGGATIFLKGGK